MRLRLLLPRGGRGARARVRGLSRLGLRLLAALALAAGALALLLVAVRGDDAAPVARDPRPAPTATPTATPPPAPTGDGLAIGITEQNPNLMWAPGERIPEVAEPFAGWARQLRELRPRYFRLIVDWASMQPSPDAPADLDRPETGCLRDKQPCSGYAGLRERLRALAARQREGGWETLVVITWTPEWAQAPGGGCERRPRDRFARPPREDALPAYRRLLADIGRAAREAGASLPWWSPWNEPNHPGFISPQRASCEPGAPTRAARPYARIAAAMRAELDRMPGEQRLVLGETAGLLTTRPTHTPVDEFIGALPTALVCSADLWTTHAYALGADPIDAVDRALRAHGCRTPLWVTETGARVDRAGGCPVMHRRLRRWHADPRVGAAFQYTFRTDDLFPTGLVSTDLTRAYPTLALWRAWSAADGPPDDPCRGS